MKPSILIVGAKGDIAKEIARVYAKNGYNLILSGRRIFEIETFSEELKSFNITVELKELDITKFDTFYKIHIYIKDATYGYHYSNRI